MAFWWGCPWRSSKNVFYNLFCTHHVTTYGSFGLEKKHIIWISLVIMKNELYSITLPFNLWRERDESQQFDQIRAVLYLLFPADSANAVQIQYKFVWLVQTFQTALVIKDIYLKIPPTLVQEIFPMPGANDPTHFHICCLIGKRKEVTWRTIFCCVS